MDLLFGMGALESFTRLLAQMQLNLIKVEMENSLLNLKNLHVDVFPPKRKSKFKKKSLCIMHVLLMQIKAS